MLAQCSACIYARRNTYVDAVLVDEDSQGRQKGLGEDPLPTYLSTWLHVKYLICIR